MTYTSSFIGYNQTKIIPIKGNAKSWNVKNGDSKATNGAPKAYKYSLCVPKCFKTSEECVAGISSDCPSRKILFERRCVQAP